MDEQPMPKADLLGRLPPPWPQSLAPEIARRVRAQPGKIAVLDDDPTGTQTVHSLWVWTTWTPGALRQALAEASPAFFVLTNSRSLPEEEAIRRNREIARNLVAAAQEQDIAVDVVSRSDSTLRGHFPAEVDALRDVLEEALGRPYDGIILCPFFLEGGRLTVGDIHWVLEGDQAVPAARTEFARDVTFGYAHSNLREWVEEKTGGRIPAERVLSIPLGVLRREGPPGVRRVLAEARQGQVVVVNAACYRDLEVFVAGLLDAEAAGQRFLFRTAASFVRVRAAVPERGLLTQAELVARGPGLVVVGSYVEKSTRQLGRALGLPGVSGVELSVREVLQPAQRERTIAQAVQAAERALKQGRDAILYTSRERVTPRGRAGDLDVAREVSQALVEVVQRVRVQPGFLVAKGGITSSDVATHALGVQRAYVLGQVLPGVPVWRLGQESRLPGLPYVVFPGNVGDDESLAHVVRLLRGKSPGAPAGGLPSGAGLW